MPSYSRRDSTSGAMYAAVPTVDFGLECSTEDLEYPKSQILRRGAGLPSSSVFSSLRSRWQMFMAWQKLTPHTSCWKKYRASSSWNRPASQMRSNSSPPAAYSITIARCVGVRTTSLNRMMLGWRRERWFTISRNTFSSICLAWLVSVSGTESIDRKRKKKNINDDDSSGAERREKRSSSTTQARGDSPCCLAL